MWDRHLPGTALFFMYLTWAEEKQQQLNLQRQTDMKKLFIYPVIILAAIAAFSLGCNKDVLGRTDQAAALTPASTDINAGDWKLILLASDSEFAVAPPVGTATPDFIVQMNEVKDYQAHITASDRAIVKYWSAGGVLRWNEIMRELVAKHNLPPYQNDDGTYPFPNANNPLAYPQFPFSNPPYAARAYAYVAAAQYDALVSAWYYKRQFNRAAPYTVDPTVNALIPKSDLPSYPSEDAVVEGASVEMLKLLFPGDQDF